MTADLAVLGWSSNALKIHVSAQLSEKEKGSPCPSAIEELPVVSSSIPARYGHQAVRALTSVGKPRQKAPESPRDERGTERS